MSISNHIIHLAPQLFKDYSGGQGKSKFKDTADNQMAALSTLPDVRRVVIHEMGHINDKEMRGRSGQPGAHVKMIEAATAWGTSARMSAYGRSADVEGYAEAFAEWTATGGKTNNQAVLDYGEWFGWTSWTDQVSLAIAAALGMTDQTGDNVIYVMTADGPVHVDSVTGAIVFDGRDLDGFADAADDEAFAIIDQVSLANEWRDELGRFARKGYSHSQHRRRGNGRPVCRVDH